MSAVTEERNDFSRGSVVRHILSLAVPMTLAQLINVLYSVVDRIYIGHLPHASAQALTGIGLCLPVITIISAFANLFGMGGAPLCSIARGGHQEDRAQKVMGNSFSMLLLSGTVLMILCLIFKEPVLGERGDIRVCGCLSDDLSSGNGFCHDEPWDEQLYQCPGIRENGDDDGPSRRSYEYHP